MKLRIPRRIKVEEESSESESETPADIDSSSAQDQVKDKEIVPVVTLRPESPKPESKVITVSEIFDQNGEIV